MKSAEDVRLSYGFDFNWALVKARDVVDLLTGAVDFIIEGLLM